MISKEKSLQSWNPGLENDEELLSEALKRLPGYSQEQISFLVQLFENPKSIFALPGPMDLFNHDCLHIFLGAGLQSHEECFVIGVSMGNDDKLKAWHAKLWKIIAQYIYTGDYRVMDRQTMKYFDDGVAFGRKLSYRNLYKIDFRKYTSLTVGELRQMLGINEYMKSKLKLIYNRKRYHG